MLDSPLGWTLLISAFVLAALTFRVTRYGYDSMGGAAP
jgi:hypothetical protein